MRHHDRWKKHYNALVQYTDRFGDALVPSGHVEFLDSGEELNLGNWVSYMRARYRKGMLGEDRVVLLESIPTWEWGPIRPGPKSRDAVMNRNTDMLKSYWGGETLSSIARKYGLSRQRVHQIVRETNE